MSSLIGWAHTQNDPAPTAKMYMENVNLKPRPNQSYQGSVGESQQPLFSIKIILELIYVDKMKEYITQYVNQYQESARRRLS